MAKMMKKTAALLFAAAVMTAGVAGAAGEKAAYVGEIRGFEAENVYLLQTTAGETVRVDLGERGGRLMWRTPLALTGEMASDAKGAYVDVHTVDYADVDPYAEYYAARGVKAPSAASVSVDNDRDAAYYHGSADSAESGYYVKGQAENFDSSAYKEASASEIAGLSAGTKVKFVGRAIATVKTDEVMTFWDAKHAEVPVVLNGTYAPLGQRCTVYGTVEVLDGKKCVSLVRLESVA